MAIVFMDSFDHYASADMAPYKWSGKGGSGGMIWAGGRKTNCFGGYNNNNDNYLILALGANYTTLIIGYAIYWGGFKANNAFFQFEDSGSAQTTFAINSNNQVYWGSYTAPLVLAVGRWYYFEHKVTFHNSTGAIEFRINEVTQFSASGLDTCATANNLANAITFTSSYYIGSGTGHTFRIDDLYLLDGTGTANNDFLGDMRVEAILANGNGAHSDFVGSDGNSTDNYLLVDEATPNYDTDYVESLTVDAVDTYACTNLAATTGTVAGVQILPLAKKTDAGSRRLKGVARLSGTDEVGANTFILSDSYQYFRDIRETKPGGGDWTITDVNNMEAGVKVYS